MLPAAAIISDMSICLVRSECSPSFWCLTVQLPVCRHLSDMAIFELSGLSHLRRLSVMRVHKLTDIALFALAEYAAGLEQLNISYCDRLSLEAIHLLLRQLMSLEYFTATGVPCMKRPGLERFSDSPPPVCPVFFVSVDMILIFRVRNMIRTSKLSSVSSATRTYME